MEDARDRLQPRTTDSGRRTPKYEQIRDDLARTIRRGDYRPGDALPSQRDLSASYGVTLMTLRQALQVLSDEGLVIQQPGRGTFIAPRQSARPRQAPSDVPAELGSELIEIDTRIIRYGSRRPSAIVRAALNLPGDQNTLRIERLCVVNGIPALHQMSWVPDIYTKNIRGVDFTKIAVHSALAEHAGLSVSRSVETIFPALVTTETARYLHVEVGSPVFHSDRITIDGGNDPFVFDRTTILGEQMRIHTEAGANGKSWYWTTASRRIDECLTSLGFP